MTGPQKHTLFSLGLCDHLPISTQNLWEPNLVLVRATLSCSLMEHADEQKEPMDK